MTTLKFSTNIKCGGCIAKVTAPLNNATGIDKWSVDTNNPQRILSVETNNLTEAEVIKIVNEAGYSATPMGD